MMSMGYIFAGVAVIIFIIIMLKMKPNALSKAVNESLETKDISHVLKVIDENASKSQQATDFNTAIKPIWDAYERELACDLIKEMLKRCGDEPIAQHWLMQVAEIEPELARKRFSEAFIKEHYKPEIAACCKGGSCGSGNCSTC